VTSVGHAYNTKDILNGKRRGFNQLFRVAKPKIVHVFGRANSNFTPEQVMEM
jgi:hypothetical protein